MRFHYASCEGRPNCLNFKTGRSSLALPCNESPESVLRFVYRLLPHSIYPTIGSRLSFFLSLFFFKLLSLTLRRSSGAGYATTHAQIICSSKERGKKKRNGFVHVVWANARLHYLNIELEPGSCAKATGRWRSYSRRWISFSSFCYSRSCFYYHFYRVSTPFPPFCRTFLMRCSELSLKLSRPRKRHFNFSFFVSFLVGGIDLMPEACCQELVYLRLRFEMQG